MPPTTGAGQRGRRRPARSWALLRLGWARGGRAVGVLDVWIWWERLLVRRQRIRAVRPGGALRFNRARYRGPRVTLADGTVVERGDPVLELHFDNRRLVELTRAGMTPWALLRILREDLAALQRSVAGGAQGQAAALHGVTLFGGGAPRLGFEVRSRRRSWHAALERLFMAGLVMLYHPGGWRAVQHQADRWPREVWMSLRALEGRYGASGCPPPGAR